MGGVDVSELRYEVMYFVDLVDDRIQEFKRGRGEIGDSIVVVGGDGLWNCHVHTNDIGAAIEVGASSCDGRPKQIRVTDLFEEIAEEHEVREARRRRGSHRLRGGRDEPVTTRSSPSAVGEGIRRLLARLGVQRSSLVARPRLRRPRELLASGRGMSAPDRVVVFPNNKNMVAVAKQAR